MTEDRPKSFGNNTVNRPVPLAARCKAWVYGCSPAGIGGSNPAGGIAVSLVSVMLRSLRRADHSSRGGLPSVACL